jgi:hypothetical protein
MSAQNMPQAPDPLDGIAETLDRAAGAAIAPNAAGYVKKTEFDNTPYRFNMTQNGKRMTADDFDAWLKANGYSAGRRAENSAPAAQPAQAEAATGQ